ncbi:MAG: glycosyltransferase [Patescibacteria group bacterium]|jgi:glycosyltransferase involved in cell wall biosynthesis
MKIAIVHDHLGFRGGGERTVLLLALRLNADFITAYAHPDTFSEYQKKLGPRLAPLSNKIIGVRVVRFFWLRYLFWNNRELFKKYDLLIASGQTATEAVANYAKKTAVKIVYTHSTPRRVFDQYELSRNMYPMYLRPAYAAFARFWKWLYLRAVKKFDINIANSENVRKRIIAHTGGDASCVIWPPILTAEFKWRGQGDYFLSWGRVDEAKRVELIVKAFKKMPEQKLIVASGGPRLEIVKKIAEGAPNITVLGWIDDEKLKELAGRCRAAVYIPIDEDAGITHLEANAAGKPYLGVREGGLVESTVDGETGILIKADPGEEDVIKAVKTMTSEWCQSRRKICEDHAKKYDAEVFMRRLEKVVSDNNPERPVLGVDASRSENPKYPGEGRRTGVEVYSKNLIDCLIPAAKKAGIRLRLYAPYTLKNLPSEIQKVIPAKRNWTRRALAGELKYSPPDYFFTPAYYIPKNAPKNSFAAIHDVIFKSNPKKYSFFERLAQSYALNRNLKRAKKIISISEYSKSEIIKWCSVPLDRIAVIPMAYTPKKNLSRNKKRKNQIIFIGRLEKKKSIDILIKAFYEFKKGHAGWNLVLAGKPGYGYDGLLALISRLNLQNQITLTGYLEEEKKWRLLAESAILVHPSADEGSSITLFEAWDARTPAIVADIPVMRENGKDAALFFAPGNKNDLADKMSSLCGNDNMRSSLIEKGTASLYDLSWTKAAEDILGIILK